MLAPTDEKNVPGALMAAPMKVGTRNTSGCPVSERKGRAGTVAWVL